MKTSKQTIRNDLNKARLEKTKKYVFTNSEKIQKDLLKWDIYKSAINIMTYMSFKNEVDMALIIKDSINKEGKIYLPYVKKEGSIDEIVLYEVSDIRHIKQGAFGNFEPDIKICKKAKKTVLDLILVPGIGFDIKGGRIGFGKGYYDKFLKNLKGKTIMIGISFESQLVDLLPTEKHDIKMDYIITEERILGKFI